MKKYLATLSDEELLKIENMILALGYSKSYGALDNKISAKGYRVLGKISKLTKKDIEKIASTFENIAEIQEAEDDELAEIKISRFKIKALRTGINRLKFTLESRGIN